MRNFAKAWSALLAALVASVPLHAQAGVPFERGVVLGSDWLQANSLPLDRSAVHSGSIDVSLRRQAWAVDLSWLRMARDLSTVQGVALSAGPLLRWRRVLFIPALGVLGGEGQESRDSTGYNWTAGSTSGHTPRYSYSSAASFGGGASLTIEIPLYRMFGVRGVAQQWYLSGAPLDGDRSRTLLGAGLSLRVGR